MHSSPLFASAVDTAQSFINTLFLVYFVLVFAYILSTWLPSSHSDSINRVQRFLYDVVTPYLRLFRRVLPQLQLGGVGLDLSPIVAILALVIANRIIQAGLELLR